MTFFFTKKKVVTVTVLPITFLKEPHWSPQKTLEILEVEDVNSEII